MSNVTDKSDAILKEVAKEPDPPKGKARWKSSEDKVDALPPRNKSFFIDFYSDYRGEHLSGEFVFRKLTIAGIGQVGARRSQLCGGTQQVDDATYLINNWLAHFDMSITKAPDWWKPYEEFDSLLMKEVYEKLVEYEDSFREAVSRRAARPAANGSAEREGGVPAAVVGS